MIQFGDYFIVANKNGFVVKACVKSLDRKTQAEKAVIKPVGSFGTFTQAVRCVANRVIIDSGSDVGLIVAQLDKIDETLKSFNGDLVFVKGALINNSKEVENV
jgi:hypothetical protein